MTHLEFFNKELYATERMVWFIEEGPEEHLFYRADERGQVRPSFVAVYKSEPDFLLPEDRVDRYKYEEDEETPLPILPSGNSSVTVTKDDIYTLHCEFITVNDENDSASKNVLIS